MLGCALAVLAQGVWGSPGVPQNVVASTNNTEGITVSWNAVAGASYYVVYRYGGKTQQTGLVQTSVTATTHFDASAEAGESIPYRVRAFNAAGEGSGYSAYVRGYRMVSIEPFVGGRSAAHPLADGGKGQSFGVRCNVDWTAASDDWILLYNGAFKGSSEVTELEYDLRPNTTGQMRTGTIEIRAGAQRATLTVVQGAVSVPGYATWCGDSARTVVEEAALPENFRFCGEYEGGFASEFDASATGGSCLKSSPITVGQRAVIAWQVPDDWALQFSWRKDTFSAGDDFAVYEGTFDSNGQPVLATATRLATCSSTAWTQVQIRQQKSVDRGIFFVFTKQSTGTADVAAGFGMLDDMLLISDPQELTFLDPPVKTVAGNAELVLPCDKALTVLTEVTFGHNVSYEGYEGPAKGLVHVSWSKPSDEQGLLGIAVGTGDDRYGDVFSVQKRIYGPTTISAIASFGINRTPITKPLTVFMTPPVVDALDCFEQLSGVRNENWTWQSDGSAFNETAAFSGVPEAGHTNELVAAFTGPGILRFAYKLTAPAADETAFCRIDGSGPLPLASSGDWQDVSIYIAAAGEHTITWGYAKGDEVQAPGSGLLLDYARFEALASSMIVSRSAATHKLADAIYTTGACAVTADADWITPVASGEPLTEDLYPFAFDVGANEPATKLRSGRVQVVCGSETNFIRVIQSRVEGTTLGDFWIYPMHPTLTGCEEQQFMATLTIGGVTEEGFTALDWEHSFGDQASFAGDGLFRAGDVEGLVSGTVSASLAGRLQWESVTIAPRPERLAPDGVTLTAENWRVGIDGTSAESLILQSANQGWPLTTASLKASMTGPGVLKGQWMVSSEKMNDLLDILLDGVRIATISGTDVDWDDFRVEVPEGEHVVSFDYSKNLTNDSGADMGFVRNLAWVPCSFAGEVLLRGPDSLSSGEKGAYGFYKVYSNDSEGESMAGNIEIKGQATYEIVTADPRTESFVRTDVTEFGEVGVKVPLTVDWADTLSLSVTIDDDGTPRVATKEIALEPISLSEVLDTTVTAFAVSENYGTEVFVNNDPLAVGGRCLKMTGESHWNEARFSMTVMDAGVLGFDYCMKDGSWMVGDYVASFRVYVDGVEVRSLLSRASWEDNSDDPIQIEISGGGPHVVTWAYAPSSRQPETDYAMLDNVHWKSTGPGSRVVGGTLDGPDVIESDMTEYGYLLNCVTNGGNGASGPAAFATAPQAWSLEFVSGDEYALDLSSSGSTAWCYANEVVTVDSIYRLRAYYSVGGVVANAEKLVTVPRREPVDQAVFDSGTYDNMWLDGTWGWHGSFDSASAGASSARSGCPEEGGSFEMSASAFGAGTLEFDWKVSSSQGDELQFYPNGWDSEGIRTISGTGEGWRHVAITFADDLDKGGEPITRQFRWVYQKNNDGVTAGEDCGWVDNIVWTGKTPPPISYAELSPSDLTLTPGSKLVVKMDFYRRGGKVEGDQEPKPTTVGPLPAVTWELKDFSSQALERAVQWRTNCAPDYLVLTLPSDCVEEGSFSIEVAFMMWGQMQYWNYTCTVAAGEVIIMEEPSSTSPSGIPQEWLQRYAPDVVGTGTLANAENVMAANGKNTLRECYMAGLDPVDTNAAFIATIAITNGVTYVDWTPNRPDRDYVIKGKVDLSDPEWVAPTNSTHRFFKVEIEWNK